MKNQAVPLPDDNCWAERSEYWLTYKPHKAGAQKKFKYREPLILCGHGVSIRVDHNTLFVRDGFTHYPQKAEHFRFFPGDPQLPDRIIALDSSGAISFDALSWMAEQGIAFLQLDWRGQITNIGGNSGYGGNPKLISTQMAIKGTKKEVEIARQLISEKIRNSIETLKRSVPKSARWAFAYGRLTKRLFELHDPKAGFHISQLRGVEGDCAAAYFSARQGLPIKWNGLSRKPIPDNWRITIPRTMTWRWGDRNARHPVNAMLNYGYGILANNVRAQVIATGLDPTIGILHGNSKNNIPLVYDLMEPLRPMVDRAVLEFALSHTFSPGDFIINRLGGCRLNPQMARSLVGRLTGFESAGVVRTYFRQIA